MHQVLQPLTAQSNVRPQQDDTPPTRAWVIVSDRTGDAKQAIAIANAIGIPYQIHHAIPLGGSIQNKSPRRQHAIKQLDQKLSSTFDAPRPPFMLAIGNWPAATALCLKQRFGSPPPIVLIGRPKPGQFDRFHAIVVSSQHLVPNHPKVIRMTFPPHDDKRARTEPSAAVSESVASLRRPITAVLIGGPTSPFRFDTDVARDLVDRIRALRDRDGGDLVIVTGPRTPPTVARVLRHRAIAGSSTFVWGIDAAELNPYSALLDHADRFIVTGDSLSMLIDVAALGRPMAIFELPVRGGLSSVWLALRRRMAADADHSPLMRRLMLQLHRMRMVGFGRDLDAVHRALIDRGIASRLSDERFHSPRTCLPDELSRVGAHIRRALGTPSTNDRTTIPVSPSHLSTYGVAQ